MTTTFLQPGVSYDYDQVACAMAMSLGLYDSAGTTFGGAKWVFVARNLVGDAIRELIVRLAGAGILVGDDDGYQIAAEYDPTRFGDYCRQAIRDQ